VGLHARIADTIRTRFSDLADTEPETLARHYQEASDVVQACEFWRRAGEIAAAKNSGAEAVGYFESALDQASKIHDEDRRQNIVFELRLLLGDAQVKAGFVHDALTTFAQTATEARQTANEPALVKSALGHSLAALYAGKPLDASIALLDEALAALPTEKAESRLRLLNAFGRSLSLSGHADRAATVSGTAISLARQLGDRRGLMETLEQSFFTPTGLNEAQIHEYRERLVELVSTAHGTGDVSAYGRALSLQVCWSAEFGDANTLTEALQKYADVADKYRIIYLMASVRHAKAMQAILNGDFALGESCAEEALEFGRGSFGSNADGPYGIQIFTIRREQGRLGEIAPLLKRFIDEGLGGAVWKPGFALIASDLGFEAPARRILDEFASRNFELPIDGKRSATLSYLAEVAVRLRDKTRARQIYELLLPYRFMTITIGIDVVCYGAATRFLGLLASTFDDEEAAVEHFEHALELNTQLRAWPWLAHTQADYAAFLKRRDHASSMERSQQLLAEAAETAERLGMIFLLRRLKEMDYSD
jgi:tetratricopeptide (TPR) repeat protein